MPRPPRLDYPFARHHVMNRGARHSAIFADDPSYGLFLGLLGELPERYGIIVHGYALMPNHFHLQLQTPHANLSAAMCFLTSRYACELNRRYEWDGPLFRARFKNRVVEDETYWRDLLAYIHLNPVKAGLATSPDNADWTSHAAYVGLGPRPDWLTCSEILDLFGSPAAYRTRLTDLATRRAPMHPDWEVAAWNETRVSRKVESTPQLPTWSESFPDEMFQRAIHEVCRITGRTEDKILVSRRGPPANKARWVLAWWLTRPGRLSCTAASVPMGLAISGVSRMSSLARTSRETDAEIADWMNRLEEQIRVPDDRNAN